MFYVILKILIFQMINVIFLKCLSYWNDGIICHKITFIWGYSVIFVARGGNGEPSNFPDIFIESSNLPKKTLFAVTTAGSMPDLHAVEARHLDS